MQKLLLDRHPENSAQSRVLLELAAAYRKVLLSEEAHETYGAFLERFPDDVLATEARQRHLALTLMLGGPVEGSSQHAKDEELDAAVAYRVIRSDESGLGALENFLRVHRGGAGPLRMFLVYARAAVVRYEAACPVRTQGLCVEVAVDGSLSVPLKRDESEVRRALEDSRRALEIAEANDLTDPWAGFGPPLEISQRELKRVAGDLLIMNGDVDAEHALRFLPPVSHDAQRSSAWLERRSEEVETMVSAYEAKNIGPIELGPGHHALSSSRQAQVYESDAGLTIDVAASLRDVDPPLHARLVRLSKRRTEQERMAYTRCLDELASWGQDVRGTARVCRRGLGRVLERYESPREFVGRPSPALLIGG